jgi:hypothetical protein
LLGVAFTTAQRSIDVLTRHRILVQTADTRRGRVYVARKLLDILDEPADLLQALNDDGRRHKR